VRTAAKQASASRSSRVAGERFEGLTSGIRCTTANSLAVLADYVTLEQGTGIVHTAPGHGADDFNTGKKYGLDIYAPVGPDGRFLDDVGLFAGEQVFEANPQVVEALTERGRLWHYEPYQHTYPHCWRCHNPVIFLATSQWFIRMDGDPLVTPDGTSPRTLRDAALHAIDQQVSGSRRGAATASSTWSPTGPTGASRASARGACRSRRSTARAAAKPS
jgi:isoleucyl-tRNA synthetase